MRSFFITGTDTGVGKTTITLGMLKKLNAMGNSTVAMKPIASGCRVKNWKLVNDDALALQQQASIFLDYDSVNPFAYEAAIAPHIAAEKSGSILNKKIVMQAITHFLTTNDHVDVALIEGAGGWQLPLNDMDFLSEVIVSLQIPAILVVGMKLGCLNHAVLTAQAISQAGSPFAGWIANCVEPNMPTLAENIAYLRRRFTAPCLGIIPFGAPVEEHLDLSLLM